MTKGTEKRQPGPEGPPLGPNDLPLAPSRWRRGAGALPSFVSRRLAPPRRVPVLVVGMSHTHALSVALAQEAERDVRVLRFAGRADLRTTKFSAEVLSGYAPQVAVSMIGGNAHVLMGLFEPDEPYDFTFADLPAAPGRRVVPLGEVRDALAFHMQVELAGIELMRTVYDCPMAHVPSPPPVREEAHLSHALSFMRSRFAANSPFNPPSVRLKLYRLQNEILRDQCARLGVRFIDPPQEGMAPDGFLAEGCRKLDPTHANASYGAAVAQQIRAFAAAPPALRPQPIARERGAMLGRPAAARAT